MRRWRLCRIASGVLLSGFVLLEPPLAEVDGEWAVRRTAPLADWTMLSTHDSALACEDARDAYVTAATYQAGDDAADRRESGALAVVTEARLAARCIPADRVYDEDPRPPRRLSIEDGIR